MQFFVGIHQPSDNKRVERAFISVNRLFGRKKAIETPAWIMDSGAFTEISSHGRYRTPVETYAAEINRWSGGGLLAAVSQDFMCEQFILDKTGLSVADHQRLTIERYDALLPLVEDVYLMPVLQGYAPADYVDHLGMYGDRLALGAWAGVGSICKRNTNVEAIVGVLATIKAARPDLRLHGFGLKITALTSSRVRGLLHTADSMAWSFAARKQGRNPNDWREAVAFASSIETMPIQLHLDLDKERPNG